MTAELRCSRLVPGTPEAVFDKIIGHPLPDLFSRRYLAFPPIRETRGSDAAWGTVGQTRTIVLSDGGTMRETLTSVERPSSFGYRIDTVRGMLAPFVSEVDGLWRFDAADGGTEVSWEWTVLATPAGRATMPVFARMWQGYARGALREVERVAAAP